jgi:hypothetical protein
MTEIEVNCELTLSPVMGQTPPLARVPATTAMLSARKKKLKGQSLTGFLGVYLLVFLSGFPLDKK